MSCPAILITMKIGVVGTGYVGLVTSAVFAKLGHQVWGVDIDKSKVKSLKSKVVPFYEPGLKKLIANGIDSKKLHFTTSYKKTLKDAEVVFICVGTPAKRNGEYNLSYVFEAAKSIAQNLEKHTIIVIKSTVPPSTNKKVKKIIKKHTDVSFNLASCPEFLREGSAVKDSLHPSRVVIGTESKKARDILLQIHKPIVGPRLITDTKSAQMIKYAANAFLATKISFINTIARICDEIGASIDDISKGLGLDPRIGKSFLRAGLGYGGSCFPKDTWALIAYAKKVGYDFAFLKQVDQVNQDQIDYFVKKIKQVCGGTVKGKRLTILGLSFKPNTSDIREARSIPIIKKLKKMGARVYACDPVATGEAKKALKNIKFFTDPYKALKNSNALILVTEWEKFKNLDFKRVAKRMKEKIIVDGRNFLNSKKLKKLGFRYNGIGRR